MYLCIFPKCATIRSEYLYSWYSGNCELQNVYNLPQSKSVCVIRNVLCLHNFGSIRQNLIWCMSYIEMVVCFMTLLNIHIFVSLLIVINITCSCCIVGRRPLFTNKRWILNYCSKEDKFTGDIEQHLIFVCPLYHNLRVSYSKPCWIAAIVWEQLNKRIMLDTSKHGTKLLPRLLKVVLYINIPVLLVVGFYIMPA